MFGIRNIFIQFVFLLIILPIDYAQSVNRISVVSEHQVYQNWIFATEKAYSDKQNEISVYDRLSGIFFDLYRESNNETYLKFSLYEAGIRKREEIIDKLTKDEIESVQNLISILRNGVSDSTHYMIRPYSFDDIYLFLDFEIPREFQQNARELLDYWLRRLPEYYSESYLKGSFVTHSLILGYYQLADHQKVYEVSRYLQNTNPFPDSSFSLDLYLFLSHSFRLSGYYLDALRLYESISIPIALNLVNMQRYYEIRMDYALTQLRIGNVNVAFNEYQDIFLNIEYLTDSRYRTALLNNLAICFLNTGRFDQYVEFQLNAFHIAQDDENIGQQIMILRNLYIFYQRQNETAIAYSYLEQALNLAREKELSADIANILIALGIYKRSLEDDYTHAFELFFEALDYAEYYSIYQQIFNSYFEIAQTYMLLGDYESTNKYIDIIIDLSQSRNDNRGYALSNVILANSYIKSGRTELARKILSQFTAVDLQQLVFNYRVMAHNLSMQIQMENGNHQAAISESTEMIAEIIDWLRESSNQETGHMRMDEEFSEAFRLHLSLLQSENKPKEALIAIGDLRNITRSGFYNNPLLKSKLLSEEQLIRDYNLSNRIQHLRSQYSIASGEQSVYLANELLAATSERNKLLNQAIPHLPETSYHSTLRNLQRQLRSDQMIFYISVFDGQIFRFSITRRNVDMKVFPRDDYYLDLIHNAISSLGYGQTNLHDLHKVYTTFFEGEIPERISHIYFIPDGQFYMLPLEILPIIEPQSSNSYGSANYFVEKYSVSYANSLSEIVQGQSAPKNDFYFDIAGFGIKSFSDAGHPDLMDLPFGPEEIINSSRVMNQFSRKKIFLDYESTKENFRDVAGKSRILHIATHSKVNNNNPLFSPLYMYTRNDSDIELDAKTDETDGIIYVYELFDMNLNADLIFLSSCESGTGGYLQGTGILGFSRAFSYAGAKSLSLNLWPIRDQTAAEIAVRFYEGLNSGKNKAEALRNAQISYLNKNNSDPYLWGAFVIYGNIDPVVSTNSQYRLAFIIIFVLIAAFTILFRFNK